MGLCSRGMLCVGYWLHAEKINKYAQEKKNTSNIFEIAGRAQDYFGVEHPATETD